MDEYRAKVEKRIANDRSIPREEKYMGNKKWENNLRNNPYECRWYFKKVGPEHKEIYLRFVDPKPSDKVVDVIRRP